MSETATELALTLPEPEVTAEEIARLVAVLHEAGGWLTAAKIAEQLGQGATDREVRKIASAAGAAVVSYPGSKGYKLWQLCTVEEIDHCITAFESQGRDMFSRAVKYRVAYARRFRGAPEGAK